ncbi:MAG TPA: hypothetical protein P5059_02190, partial [Candidatus Dojkabacteria bacterium]|nr:hypothetical protein [Candidatus Dojkabacteria bacterium]
LKVCPLPLEETEQYISKGYNLGGASTLKLEDFRRCINDCDVGPNESNDDCYEVESPQPVETFSIVDTAVPLNKYDYKDQSMFPYSHTGQYDASNIAKQGDLNDPTGPIEMIATYTDSNGASDIEGMFVWFRREDVTGPYGMPVHISSATPQGPAQNSWGFMLKRSGTGWLPYVTSFQPSTPVWTRVVYEHYPDIPEYAKFFLPAPNQTDMIEVTVIPAPTVSADGKSITMKFSLRFTNNGNLFGTQKASEGKYKILLMGLDKFSFTPFDNYDVAPDLIDFASFWDSTYLLNGDNFTHYWTNTQLRYIDGVQSYARDWFDTGKTWTLDFTDPYFNPNTTLGFTKEVIENSVKVSWNVKDNQNLFAIVGNIYVDGSNQKPLTLFDETAGVILRGSEIYPLGPDDTNTVIGKLVKDDLNSRTWSFKVNPNLSTDSHTGSVTIGVGDNTVGNLIVWLTVFDDAGNVARTSISQGLSDRFLTGGGLVFSPSNSFSTLPLPNDATNWTNILPPYSSSPSEGLIKGNAGFTSEMYANSGAPSNSGVAESFGISNFTRWIRTTPPASPPLYDSLLRKYELHKKYIQSDLYEFTYPGDITLSDNAVSNLFSCNSKTYCTFFVNGNLGVSNVRCNKRTLVFVQGNLTITPPFDSDNAGSISNLNGCIFVVGGTVTIAPNPAVSGTFSYDRINAFIVSDGVITIAHDPDPSTIVDGVYINGGLISKGGGDSIDIKRYLRLEERLVYPVFAIDLHPKYGILAEKFFGNSYVIQSTEVGLKPY